MRPRAPAHSHPTTPSKPQGEPIRDRPPLSIVRILTCMAVNYAARVRSFLLLRTSGGVLDSFTPLPGERHVTPYGSWPTPITSQVVVAQAVRLHDAKQDGDDLVWSEARPAEGGRTALVRRSPDGTTNELLDRTANARTAVHEYGGGAWWVRDGVVWYAEWADQRLCRRDPESGVVTALTPEPDVPRGDRYADGDV